MSKNNSESKSTDLLACPCCGYGTLASRNEFEICEICWWEDDGQDNDNASQVLGGPNSNLSLTRARFNFLKYGIFDPKRVDLRSRQESTEGYAKYRVFVLDETTHSVTEPAVGWQAVLADDTC